MLIALLLEFQERLIRGYVGGARLDNAVIGRYKEQRRKRLVAQVQPVAESLLLNVSAFEKDVALLSCCAG